MPFSDETLMAYADGELDDDTRRRVQDAMAHDPSIAERVAKHRELRADLGAAFDGVLDEPMPARLLDTVGLAKPETNAAGITNLSAAREAKQRSTQPKRWGFPEWMAIAASLLVGIVVGRSALQPQSSTMFATNADGVVATGELSAALTDQLGGASEGAAIHIGMSFLATGGEYCRSFTTQTSAGFACRTGDAWQVRALSESTGAAGGGEYRMAGSELPSAILAAIEGAMAGDALDREQEQAARLRGWKK